MNLRDLSYEQFDQLTDLHTDKRIGEQFSVGKNYVGYCRRRLGVKSFGEKNGIVVGVRGVSNVSNRKYQFNERFFQVIDSEIKAYALGLMMTDGHITKSLHRARIALTEADSAILHKIAAAASFTGKLIVSKPRSGNYQVSNMINLNFNSTLLVQDLLALGLTTSKDKNLALPKIDSSLEHHMIRGIIDGDGAVLKSGELICLSGRKEFLEDIVNCFSRHGFTKVGGIYSDKTIYRLRMPKYAIPAIDWVYECNPSIVLERKLELYRLRKAFDSAWTIKY